MTLRRRVSTILFTLAAALLVVELQPRSAHGQTRAPLFADDERIEFTLEAPLRTLVARRARRPTVEGTIETTGADGMPVTLDVEITARGNNRLEVCSFPPLSLRLESRTAGTAFAGHDLFELSTRCRAVEAYEQYLELEYLVYRMYDQVADYALAVRPASVRYVDTDRRRTRVDEAPAFFVERFEQLGNRFGLTVADVERITSRNLHRRSLATMTLFQYLVGNTDWSTLEGSSGQNCCHNVVPFASADSPELVVVPFDFDQSGIIDASYAVPNEILRIRSVRQRVYRGFCTTNDLLDETITRFNEARPRMEALFEDDRLTETFRKRALDYLNRSFELINDPSAREREIDGACRD